MTYGRQHRSLTSDGLGSPRKGHNVGVNHGCHLPTPIHVHIIRKDTEVLKFQALKLYGTQISLDMSLEIRSQVRGHSRYGLEFFVTIGRSVRELFSENPRWGLHQPPTSTLCRRGLTRTLDRFTFHFFFLRPSAKSIFTFH